jgi:hypothetical protein
MNRIAPDKIHITSIKIFKSNLNVTPEYLEDPVTPEEIKVGYSQESGFYPEENRIRIRLEVQLIALGKEKNELGLNGEYSIEFHFIVENLKEFVIKPENDEKSKKDFESPLLSGVLGGTIMSIAYSTARGIILERTQGTFFDGVILPVINPNDLL